MNGIKNEKLRIMRGVGGDYVKGKSLIKYNKTKILYDNIKNI